MPDSSYDGFAADYDRHFLRQVDRWENELLASWLRPQVTGKRVLDLGCGTGWVADHCNPADYTGVDTSPAMLEEMLLKHPGATAVKLDVSEPGWQKHVLVPGEPLWDCITATWSLEYLGNTERLLSALPFLLAEGGSLALHGSLPRGHRRSHFSVKEAPYQSISPLSVKLASIAAGLGRPKAHGTSAMPDWMTDHADRMWWNVWLMAPASLHYACLWRWFPYGR